MAIDRAYRRVASALRAEILAGDLPEGSQLPSQRELAERFEVPRATIERALATLRGDGLIISRQGAGAFVRRFERIIRSSPDRLAQTQWGTGQTIQDHDTSPLVRTVDVVISEVPAPDYVAAAFDVPPGTLVLARDRRFAVEGRFVQLATSHFPLELARGTAITYTDSGPGGVYARLADAGHAPTNFVERLVIRMPLPGESERLGLPPDGAPVVQVTRFAYASERCVEVNRMVLDAAAYELVYRVSA